jgi:hypothetical protein
VAIGPANLPRLGEISLDVRSLGFTLALSLFAGLLFGSIPALRYARARTTVALRGGGRTASLSRERQHSRDLLVVAQVAMAMVLLVSAVLMIRTFQALRHVEPGFSHPEHVQTVRISIPGTLVAEPQQVVRLQNSIPWVSQAPRQWKESYPIGVEFLSRGRTWVRCSPYGCSNMCLPIISGQPAQGSLRDAS